MNKYTYRVVAYNPYTCDYEEKETIFPHRALQLLEYWESIQDVYYQTQIYIEIPCPRPSVYMRASGGTWTSVNRQTIIDLSKVGNNSNYSLSYSRGKCK
jgi:hypothetical protein